LVLAHVNGRFVVNGALPGSPADACDIRQGDVIVRIDGVETHNMSWDAGLRRISGRERVPVTLVINRNNQELGISIPRERLGDILHRSGLKTEDSLIVPEQSRASLSEGMKAPGFEGRDLFGKELIMHSGAFGQPTLLVFWTSWCPGCARAITMLTMRSELATKGGVIVGINLDENPDKARMFLQEAPFGDYQLAGGGWFGEISQMFHVYRHGVPWFVAIGGDGTIEAQGRPEEVLDAWFAPEGTLQK
jgi:thiol-disulfide isomerase/thioredoxin